MPKVTIIVPIYKVEKYLPQCVDSILAQTLQEIEVILVDDGSPDGSPALCDAYAQRDSRVRVIHKPNGGLLHARMAGTAQATGAYVGFVDGDDFVGPDYFAALYDAAERFGADMVEGGATLYWESGRQEMSLPQLPAGGYRGEKLEKEFYPRFFYTRAAGQQGHLAPAVWRKLFRRELLAGVYAKLPSQVRIGEDMITSYSVALQADCIAVAPGAVEYFYRQREDSMINAYWRNYPENLRQLLEVFQKADCPPAARPYLERGRLAYGRNSLLWGIQNELHCPDRSPAAALKDYGKAIAGDAFWQDYLAHPQIGSRKEKLLLALLRQGKSGLLACYGRLWSLKNR